MSGKVAETKLATKWAKAVLGLSLIWWFVIFGFRFATLEDYNITFGLRDTARVIQGSMFMIVFFVALYTLIKLLQVLQQRKTEIGYILMIYFVTVVIGAFLQGFFTIFEFTPRRLQSFFTDTAFLFVAASTILLSLFIIQTFTDGIEDKKNQKILVVIAAVMVLAPLGITLNFFFDISDIVILVPTGLMILIIFWAYGTLFKKAWHLSQRVETELTQKSFKMIAFSGICIILAFLIFAILIITNIFILRFIDAILFAAGYFLLYQGFVLPMKVKTKAKG